MPSHLLQLSRGFCSGRISYYTVTIKNVFQNAVDIPGLQYIQGTQLVIHKPHSSSDLENRKHHKLEFAEQSRLDIFAAHHLI